MRCSSIRKGGLVVLGAALCATAAGCDADRGSAHGDHARRVYLREADFRISAPERVPAGNTRLVVRNTGPDDHELLVVRAGATTLPLRRDGTTMDEDAVKKTTLGVIEPAQPGTVHELRVRLRPGRYLLLCNMSGHYGGGMHRPLLVQ
jgi:hypothetical protein